jgi:hypothetical protein
MEKTQSLKEFVKQICKEAKDETIILVIKDFKNKPFNGIQTGYKIDETWFSISKDYFKKYLKMFGRTNISL